MDAQAAATESLTSPWMTVWRAIGLAKQNQMWLMRHNGFALPPHEAELLAAAEAPLPPDTPLKDIPDHPMRIVRAFLARRAAAGGVGSLLAAMTRTYTSCSGERRCTVVFLDRCTDENQGGPPTEPQSKQVPIYLVAAALDRVPERERGRHSLVMVAPGKLTFRAEEMVRAQASWAWVWSSSCLAVVPQQHDDVHKHVEVPAADARKLMDGLSIEPQQLPRMLVSDPIATFQMWPRNTIVKCCRFLGEGCTYRLVR